MIFRTCVTLSLLIAFTTTVPTVLSAEQDKPALPNVVLIVADDLGYADVSFHGGKIPTPAIDRIAAEGVALDRFYACPVCSPTRAGLMTGRWPIRMGIMRSVIPPWNKWGIPAEENTIAELLDAAGYVQRGMFGKWHLGHGSPAHHPLANGFSLFYGHYNGNIDYFTHEREGEVDWHRNRETVREEGYSTDLLGEAAAQFIANAADEYPFFVYLPFNAPHSPFQAPEEDVARFSEVKNKQQRIYYGMVSAMDRAVGRVLKALDEKGAAENTFVLFMSDNGGVRGLGDNTPWRGGKSTLYEGGIRVAAAARWPAGRIVGGGKINEPIGYIDVYPTLWRIVGQQVVPKALPVDGIDALDILRGEARAPQRDWYSYIAMTDPEEHISVISADHKLVVHGPTLLDENPEIKRQVELFDLANDPGEMENIASANQDLVKRLMPKLKEFRALKTGGVNDYREGREGFVAPKDWIIRP